MTTMWPEGQYQGHIVRAEAVIAQTGTRGIELTFSVQGREVRSIVWVSEKSIGIATGTLRAVGWNGEFGDNMHFEPGGPVLLRCEHEEYRGSRRERWSIVRQCSRAANDDPVFARLSAQYKARVGGAAPMAPTVPVMAPAAPTAIGAQAPGGSPPSVPPAPAAPTFTPQAGHKAYGDWGDFSFPGAPKASQTPPAVASDIRESAPPPPPPPTDGWSKERAWARWVENGCQDAAAFWAAAARAGIVGDNGTSEQWREVASAAPPF